MSYFNVSIDDLPIIIAFNKQDLKDKFNAVDFLVISKYYKYKNIDARDTSALKGEGIINCFEDILGLILRKYYNNKFLSTINQRSINLNNF